LSVGEPANLTLVNPSAHYRVDPKAMVSRSRNTPYADVELAARPVMTFLRGRLTAKDGVPQS
jgi:dihydroorotase